MYRILTLLIIIMGAAGIMARTQRTTRKGLTPNTTQNVSVRTDSVTDTFFLPVSDSLKISGYDKPLRSTRETMFVTNNTKSIVRQIRLSIRYSDTHGRELHSREATVDCVIPPGATRQIALKSWDIQKSFYYKRSPKPGRTDATPYDITCDILYYLTD